MLLHTEITSELFFYQIVERFLGMPFFPCEKRYGSLRPFTLGIKKKHFYGPVFSCLVLCRYDLADTIAFHGKPFPWFVSDVTRDDFYQTLALCRSATGVPAGDLKDPHCSSSSWGAKAGENIRALADGWQGHVEAGRWRYVDHPFWCTPAPFSWMQVSSTGA
jgi:hypothetical protein